MLLFNIVCEQEYSSNILKATYEFVTSYIVILSLNVHVDLVAVQN